MREAATRTVMVEAAERERFGVDHAIVGAWLAEGWGMTRPICDAIRCHHAPDAELAEPLVPLVHVAEVLSNALDPTGDGETQVGYLSKSSCDALGLKWEESAIALFGRIDALSRFVATTFRPAR